MCIYIYLYIYIFICIYIYIHYSTERLLEVAIEFGLGGFETTTTTTATEFHTDALTDWAKKP